MNTLESGPPQQAAGPLAWAENNYVTRVFGHPSEVATAHWQALLAAEQTQGRMPQPFATPDYWAALHDSGSATPETGWQLQLLTLWREPPAQDMESTTVAALTPAPHLTPSTPCSPIAPSPPAGAELLGACALYIKAHSYGEYVFDWAWADAHARHGLPYYPKGLVAVPFTPVPGPRLLAVDSTARAALMSGLLRWSQALHLSSLHLLFAHEEDLATAQAAGLMLRHTVQFHWHNAHAAEGGRAYTSFEEFLACLSQDKRKKIRQERRKVADAGVRFVHRHGHDITPADWDFFYACYERTYLEHGNAPYLTRDFFRRMAQDMAEHWLMCLAHRADGTPIACSLIALSACPSSVKRQKDINNAPGIAYGRYWGALQRVDCLHFEACYYQPMEWCIAHGYARFEGGAQGEHKMARALLPVRTSSAHWLAHPAFADAVDRYLAREGQGIGAYLENLHERTPFRAPVGAPRGDAPTAGWP